MLLGLLLLLLLLCDFVVRWSPACASSWSLLLWSAFWREMVIGVLLVCLFFGGCFRRRGLLVGGRG